VCKQQKGHLKPKGQAQAYGRDQGGATVGNGVVDGEGELKSGLSQELT